jgi:hypothetical protein
MVPDENNGSNDKSRSFSAILPASLGKKGDHPFHHSTFARWVLSARESKKNETRLPRKLLSVGKPRAAVPPKTGSSRKLIADS